ncbi:MAG: dTDP-glucose 4,6-dehydratase [Candidatus Aenigmarchaeota archaeon]|nr:dTDP-glucose 4,6-dehydratase [Candidatus Aenigmarchaeota archaeon]
MRLLVTGGSGFIGSNFIRQLPPGTEVVNLDVMTYAGKSGIDLERPGYRLVQGDIGDPAAVRRAMADCDAVVHFAAESHVDRSIQDATSFLRTNVLGTYTLLEEARKQDCQRFIMISTDEVYGQIASGSFRETDVLNPRNPYSASKAAADRLAYSFFATYGLPVVITRSSNNFGPFQYPEKIIPLFITNLLRGKKVPVYGDGLQVRDWLYVLDNCEAIRRCLDMGKAGEIYNIGGGNEVTNLELTRLILREMGKGEEMIEHVNDRPGHDRRYSLDSAKMHDLGWAPRHPFAQALSETIRWYTENQRWWKPLIS